MEILSFINNIQGLIHPVSFSHFSLLTNSIFNENKTHIFFSITHIKDSMIFPFAENQGVVLYGLHLPGIPFLRPWSKSTSTIKSSGDALDIKVLGFYIYPFCPLITLHKPPPLTRSCLTSSCRNPSTYKSWGCLFALCIYNCTHVLL